MWIKFSINFTVLFNSMGDSFCYVLRVLVLEVSSVKLVVEKQDELPPGVQLVSVTK